MQAKHLEQQYRYEIPRGAFAILDGLSLVDIYPVRPNIEKETIANAARRLLNLGLDTLAAKLALLRLWRRTAKLIQ